MNLFQQLFGLGAELERALEKRVDLVDWQVARKPELRASIESSAQAWYVA
jgi:predicted nucleotidyltransferase